MLPRHTPVATAAAAGDDLAACIRVALVEDDAFMRTALAHAVQSAPDMRLQWVAATRAAALQALKKGGGDAERVDVLLVDLGLPDGSGMQVIAAARQAPYTILPMVVTVFGDEQHILQAVEAGAMGYLLKDLSPAEVLVELRSLHAGGSPINPMVARKLLLRQAELAQPTSSPHDLGNPLGAKTLPRLALSARELQVLQLVARGHTMEETAAAMQVSRHTVRTFVRRVYAKLQVNTRTEAVSLAMLHGWLPFDAGDI